MNAYKTARAAHDAHKAAAPQLADYETLDAWRDARVAHAQAGAATLPNLRHAELADLADHIAEAVALDATVFDLPGLIGVMTEPRNWLAAGGLSKRGRAALDAVTPAGYKLYLSAGRYSYTVAVTPEGATYYQRAERTYYQRGEGTPYTYRRTTPRTLAELIAADDELTAVTAQIRELEDRRAALALILSE